MAAKHGQTTWSLKLHRSSSEKFTAPLALNRKRGMPGHTSETSSARFPIGKNLSYACQNKALLLNFSDAFVILPLEDAALLSSCSDRLPSAVWSGLLSSDVVGSYS